MPGRRIVGLAGALVLLAAAAPSRAATPGQACEKKAVAALRTCGKVVTKQELICVQHTGAACAPGDAVVARALATVSVEVLKACPDVATVTAAGYPPLLTPAGLTAKLQEACTSEAASLFARSFGGPHAAVRTTAVADRPCLDYAYGKGRTMVDYALKQQTSCILKAHGGGTCDPATVAARIAAREAKTAGAIARRCADLGSLIGLDPAAYTSRASTQSHCLVATAHGRTAPLALDCGPRADVPVPPPGVATQIVLPSAVYGTKCGDGSDYAFWIRMPPAGQPASKVVVHVAGGGACYDGPTCAAQNPDLFEALTDGMGSVGILSNTNAANPFLDWVQVSLPYCTQDLHIGGGVTDVFAEMTVNRYGALNLRAALGYVRDVVWAAMDAADGDGYRPDRMQMMLSGSSAGGYGVAYNYHWVLDDLRWVHSTAVPDAGLGMDNGRADGVIALGTMALLPTTPGWNVKPFMPPYCQTAACAENFITLDVAQSPRLEAVPEQQILQISNQVDAVQRNTTNFLSNGEFVNALRSRYCTVEGLPGLHAFLRASSTPVHGEVNASTFYTVVIGGTTMAEWLGGAATDPEGVIDKIATGTIVPDISGALPFPCTVGSPSGAFL